MAEHAQLLNDPNGDVSEEPTLSVTWGVVRAALIGAGDRRLEAETYLSDGYGRRVAIEARPAGWLPMRDIADVWQPSRLKGITLPEHHGTPFLSAGQVFEDRPHARKWLSVDRTPNASSRFVDPGMLLLSCSGTVGRITLAYRWHADHIITHDLLRIVPHSERMRGWLYSYMRTASFRAMATGAHYGHMIKHLEPSHVLAMPVVDLDEAEILRFADGVRAIFDARNRADSLFRKANAIYESALSLDVEGFDLDSPFTVRASRLLRGRRRLDAYHFNDAVARIETAMAASTERIDRLEAVTEGVWWPNRFSRAFGENGTPYVSAVELFDLNPPITKHIYAGLVPTPERYFVKPGWLLMARSGQIYGLNGRVFMSGERHSHFFVSEDLIRIVPDSDSIRSGYLLTVLGHPTLGRPLVLRHAYGTSIPHLEPGDLAGVPIPRFADGVEGQIADLVEEAVSLRSSSDDQEDNLTDEAEAIIAAFLHDEF